MLVVAAFFGGVEFGAKREQQRLASERAEVNAALEKERWWLRRAAELYDKYQRKLAEDSPAEE